MTQFLNQREFSSLGRSETLICWYYFTTGSLMGPSKLHLIFLAPIGMWNYHFETPFGLARTTNIVETWHCSFNATVGCHHPTVWKLICSLKREQGLVEVRHAKFISGAQSPKRVKTQGNEQVLKDLIHSYMYRPRMELLRGIVHHFNMDSR
ncbi:hypothetical protein LOD99_9507 [Oopsacas minuta]|uniref:Uncharacterized protein n=1 Tax=Oopsacas minuta TaxID=111878 RepID=A0AAV7JBI9_9METZ|nr:hypothetical protein LOD99_9507 [Oopsacas minuta]